MQLAPLLRGTRIALTALLGLLAVSGCGGGSSGGGGSATLTITSAITSGTAGGIQLIRGVPHSFTLTVNGSQAGTLGLRLLNPEPGMVLSRTSSAPGTAQFSVRWIPLRGGSHRLIFRATDGASALVTLTVDLFVLGSGTDDSLLADVTGDGVLDLVAVATQADMGGVIDAGAIYIWAGQTTPTGAPTATLTVPGAVANDQLGVATGQGIQCADVTGDGILDVVAGAAQADVGGVLNTGAIYVWAGGPALAGTPVLTATLTVPGAVAGDQLGNALGQGIQCADVTGDGILDVVAGTTSANVGGSVNTGAIYVWAGGSVLAGTPALTASLTVPGAVDLDALGVASGQGIQCADVTGDGILDVVAGAILATVGGVDDAGTIYVWAGGSTLVGVPALTATLTVPGAVAFDFLGNASGQGIQCADVTGDGTLDIVAGASSADVGGVVNTGAIYVWSGGSALVGTPALTATLTVPGGVANDLLGFASGQGIQCADVTGDGILDVVAGATGADVGGVDDAGAIYVWAGGSTLVGVPALTATLAVPGAVGGDQLGNASGQGIQCADVTGDGILDVVAGATQADVGGVNGTGAIYVWAGGSTLAGVPALTATLTVPGAVAGDLLGFGSGQGIQCADLTGDGILDVVAGANNADVGGVQNTGAIYVWAGGATLAGTPVLTATLTVPGGVANDFLGNASRQGIQCLDVTGDGIFDVVAGASSADVGGVQDTGAIYIWAGGATLAGIPALTATLTVPGAVANDLLGNARGQGIQCLDVTGDGSLDVVAGTRNADVGGVVNTGAIYVWEGGSALAGTPALTATLTVPGAVAGDRLGEAFGQAVLCADVTGDGILDVVGGAALADVGGVRDTGALYLWTGGLPLPAVPSTIFAVPGAIQDDYLSGFDD